MESSERMTSDTAQPDALKPYHAPALVNLGSVHVVVSSMSNGGSDGSNCQCNSHS